MSTLCHKQVTLKSFFGKEVVADFEDGKITSDAGTVLFREIDSRHGITESLAKLLHDPHRSDRIRHEIHIIILRQRLYFIGLGYEDNNDPAFLRSNPAIKIAAERLPDSSADLASQPTLCRFENTVTKTDLLRLSDLMFLQNICSAMIRNRAPAPISQSEEYI